MTTYKHDLTDDERRALAELLASRTLSSICHNAIDRFVNERSEAPRATVVTFTAMRVVRGALADNTTKHTLDALREAHAKGRACIGMHPTDDGLMLFFREQTER